MLGFVERKWIALGAVHGGLSPFLSVTPLRWTRKPKLYRGFTVGFMEFKCRIKFGKDFSCTFYIEERKTIYITH